MEYIIIGLLILIVIINLIPKKKDVTESNIIERLGRLEKNMTKELGDFKYDMNKELVEEFIKINKSIEEKLYLINEKVNERIDENFEKTNKTFNSILERLYKIDEAQKKIETLSGDIVSLQSVLTDKKTRGIFGEVNLQNIMSNVFGENNKKIYKMQHPLSNGTIVDCVLFGPDPLGMIGIDSKFPLENYRIMVDKKVSPEKREMALKYFRMDMKKHIDAIADKYIIEGETSNQAMLFLPAEAIFAELLAYHSDIIDYAYKRRVWITSPTTLMSTLTTLEVIMKNIERDKYAKVIHKELNLLSAEFKRYKERWDKLAHSIDVVSRDVKDIYTTTEKITKKFDSINNVEMIELNEKNKLFD